MMITDHSLAYLYVEMLGCNAFTTCYSANRSSVVWATQLRSACLQGVRFDPELPQVLRMEFAKTNTKMLTKPKMPQHHHLQQQQQQLQAASSMSPLLLTAPPAAFINQFAARTYQSFIKAVEMSE